MIALMLFGWLTLIALSYGGAELVLRKAGKL
jgi:hypothetical protein